MWSLELHQGSEDCGHPSQVRPKSGKGGTAFRQCMKGIGPRREVGGRRVSTDAAQLEFTMAQGNLATSGHRFRKGVLAQTVDNLMLNTEV